jgi:hypothetical protein
LIGILVKSLLVVWYVVTHHAGTFDAAAIDSRLEASTAILKKHKTKKKFNM